MDFNKSIFFDGELYDAFHAASPLFDGEMETETDIAFWLQKVKDYGDPVLELGCGTGRVSIPLMEAGFSVVGVDFSESMLARARQKSDRVEWVQADIRTLDLERKFTCILAPYFVLNYFPELEDLEAVLNTCKAHLDADGKLIVDLMNPGFEFFKGIFDRGDRILPDREIVDPRTQEKIRSQFGDDYDFASQIYAEPIFYHFPDGKVVSDRIEHRLYAPQEIKAILKYNGFQVDASFGSYDGTPLQGDSVDRILVCSRLEL